MNKNELCVNIKLLHENEKLPYKIKNTLQSK